MDRTVVSGTIDGGSIPSRAVLLFPVGMRVGGSKKQDRILIMIEDNTKIRLKFSEIAEALRDGRVEMDGDGLLLGSDAEACTGRVETAGCAGLKCETVYRLAVGALSTLMHSAMSMNPKAMAALAEWYAVGERDESLGDGLGALLAVVKKAAGGEVVEADAQEGGAE